jgi:Meiotically up-regulated gene 113
MTERKPDDVLTARDLARQEAGHSPAHWLEVRQRNRERLRHSGGDVYFLQHETGGLIKIGVSVHVPSRVASLNAQTHDPRYRVLAIIPGGGTLYERIFHDEFAHLREHGEWFRAEQDLLDFIARAKEMMPSVG